jgi:hypothetical protein
VLKLHVTHHIGDVERHETNAVVGIAVVAEDGEESLELCIADIASVQPGKGVSGEADDEDEVDWYSRCGHVHERRDGEDQELPDLSNGGYIEEAMLAHVEHQDHLFRLPRGVLIRPRMLVEMLDFLLGVLHGVLPS